ncbi:MAG: peptidase P60 [Azospirillum sp.]|nr:peptidase P60 [Azospirillum sp.]
MLDPRRHPYRSDLAAATLAGRVEASRFVEGQAYQSRAGRTPIAATPDDRAARTSELLYGEIFTVYDRRDDWAWGQCATDGYVGWLRSQALYPDCHPLSHRVDALRSFIFPAPDLKAPPRDFISLGSPVSVVGADNGFAALADGGWVFAKHVTPLGTVESDLVSTALRLLGVPYLWGGRSTLGIDCSGLVQLAMAVAGIPCPRDSDMQRAELGALVADRGVPPDLRRGDLVFFAGHVGLMADPHRLLHANAFTMTVAIETLAEVSVRAGPVLATRRVSA